LEFSAFILLLSCLTVIQRIHVLLMRAVTARQATSMIASRVGASSVHVFDWNHFIIKNYRYYSR